MASRTPPSSAEFISLRIASHIVFSAGQRRAAASLVVFTTGPVNSSVKPLHQSWLKRTPQPAAERTAGITRVMPAPAPSTRGGASRAAEVHCYSGRYRLPLPRSAAIRAAITPARTRAGAGRGTSRRDLSSVSPPIPQDLDFARHGVDLLLTRGSGELEGQVQSVERGGAAAVAMLGQQSDGAQDQGAHPLGVLREHLEH